MEISSQINTFSSGMDTDTDVSLMQEGTYRYAENIRILTDKEGTSGAIQNIEYIRQYLNNIPSDETIIGTAVGRYFKNDESKECGIVLTKKTVDSKIYNKLYTITDFESVSPTITVVVKGYLNIWKNVSIVTNYEGPTISKVYISDGESCLKIINIQKEYPEITDDTYFDITPGAVLAPFRLKRLVSGSLPAGAIQYCYQLFSVNGSETCTSSLSNKIIITPDCTSTNTFNGYATETVSDRGCELSASAFNDGRYDRIRVISIQYLSSIDTPRIYIISESDFTSNSNGMVNFEYTDNGSGYIRELTIDEFNDLVPYEFKATSIAKKDNMLFASNIQEITWDVDFDARAYRANPSGQVKLESTMGNDITATMTSIVDGNTVIPEDHDCINPMNGELIYPSSNSEYGWIVYGSTKVRGGKGPNVSYRFITTDFIEQEIQSGTGLYEALDMRSTRMSLSNGVPLYYIEGDKYTDDTRFGTSLNVVRNYCDSFFSSNYLSYQRDETYRFGIILYNEKNIPSPVHWIGDVRFPDSDICRPFLHNTKDRFGNQLTYELISRPLGIVFTVNNLPKEVVAYEIVRCKRNFSDRTVVTQGVLSKTVNYRGNKGSDSYDSAVSLGDIDRRPYLSPTFSKSPKRRALGLSDNFIDPVDNSGVFDFTSADQCFNKTQNLIDKGMYLAPLYFGVSQVGDNAGGVSVENIKGSSITQTPSEMINSLTEFSSEGAMYDSFHTTLQSDDLIAAYLVKPYCFVNRESGNDSSNSSRCAKLIEDCIVAKNIPNAISEGIKDIKGAYSDYVGNMIYTNYGVSTTSYGPHGITTAIYCPQMYNTTNGANYSGLSGSKFYESSVLYCNVKRNTSQYGGNNYAARTNSIYEVNCAYVKGNLNNYQQAICFSGDTYLGLLDYGNTMLFTKNDVNADNIRKSQVQSYIPLESSVNVYARYDHHYSQDASIRGANIFFMTEPGQLNVNYVQSDPAYSYNSAYSNVSGSKKYISKSLYSVDNALTENRIVNSDVKTNSEIIDSWSKFKYANYLDVDSQYGPITNLKVNNNQLIFFQDNAVGIASVNERSLITDDNSQALVLGTGSVLSRADYITVNYGCNIKNSKSISTSNSTLYWYDLNKNVICALNNSFIELSKVKKVQNYLNQLPSQSKENVVSFYDPKFNEVWFRLKDKSLIFNEQTNTFTSFYTHSPNWYMPFSDKTITIKDNNMFYLHNIYETNSDEKEERISKIQFVVNKDASLTKVFDNVQFDAKFIDVENDKPQIITGVAFDTKTQTTNSINYQNIENREDNYRFYIPREKQEDSEAQQILTKSYAGRLRGKYLICNYTFDCNNGREMKIPFIKTTYRYSMI